MRPPAPWRLIDVEIDDPAPLCAPVDRPVYAVLRRHGAFVGVTRLLPDRAPMTRAEAAHTVAHDAATGLALLAAIGEDEARYGSIPSKVPCDPVLGRVGDDLLARADMALAARRARPPAIDATVAICTRGRPQDLAACLAACVSAGVAPADLLVVDNGPDTETRAVAEAAGARYVEARPAGLNRARNVAIAASTTGAVVFVDDDVRPEPGFLQPLLARFDAPDIGVVCGCVLPAALDTEAQIAFQIDLGFGGMGLAPLVFDQVWLDGAATSPPVWNLGAGAVMAVRRETALAIGDFDERIGAGAFGGCGDDSEFWRRALEHGWRLRYEPLSIVRHRHRETMGALETQAFQYGKGHVAAVFASWGRHGQVRDLRYALLTLPFYYAKRLVRTGLSRQRRLQHRLTWLTFRGWLAGLSGWRLARPPSAR